MEKEGVEDDWNVCFRNLPRVSMTAPFAPGEAAGKCFSLSQPFQQPFRRLARRDGFVSVSPLARVEIEVGSVTTPMNIGFSCDLKRNIQR